MAEVKRPKLSKQQSLCKFFTPEETTANASTITELDESGPGTSSEFKPAAEDHSMESDSITELESDSEPAVSLTASKVKSKSTHRKSGFTSSWQKNYAWLLYDNEERAMYCKLCMRYGNLPRNGSGKWVKVGCTSLRHDKLLKHTASAMHRDSEISSHEEARASLTGGIRGALEVPITEERKAVIGALKCLYFLAKNELPHTTKFTSLVDFSINMGCSFMKQLRRGGNASYRSKQVVAEFLFCLSDCIKQKVLLTMRNSPTISILIDESTDVSILKQLVMYGRCIVDGKLECHFLNIKDIPDGRASTIEKSVLDILQESGLDITNVSSFGSDGASVMTGRRTGVAARLKALNGNLISIHCVAHRLALAAGQASQSVPYLKRFKEIVGSLFYFYHNSSVRQAGLSAIQMILDDPVLRLKQAKDVRWLSHHAAIDALRRCLISVLTSLDREASERSEPTASGLFNFMRKYFFVASLSLFADVLPHLSKLSRTLQSSSLDFSILTPVVDSCILSIEKLLQSPGKNLSEIDLLIARLDEAGFTVKAEENLRSNFDQQVRIPYISKLIENLKDRFPTMKLISCFSIFTPSELPQTDCELLHYGEGELDTLLSHYSEGPLALDHNKGQLEWREFKNFLSKQIKNIKSIKELSEIVLSSPERRQIFPIMSELLSRGLVLPIATADCERGFSAVNRIKTCPRNSLKTDTLEELMYISIEGPPLEEFNFEEAADICGRRKNRRIHWQS